MSEYLSHAAVYDDLRRLALRHDGLPEAFHAAFRQFPDYGRAGSVTRGNYEHVVPMLAEYRTRWTPDDEAMTQRLAFAMGWISHRAADRHIKPVAVVTEPEFYEPDGEGSGISKPRVWQDLVLYDAVYDEGRAGTIPEHLFSRHLRDHETADALDLRSLEPVVHAQWLEGMAALHVAVSEPSAAPLAERLDAFLDARQNYYVPLGDYADRIEDPPPEEVQRFVYATHLYDADDPLIALAHAPEGGAGRPLAEARAATDDTASQYALTLARGLGYLDAAGAFWDGDISRDALEEAFDFNSWVRSAENTELMRELLDRYAR